MANETRPVTIIAGAGSGIGRGCALKLATLGHALVLVGRDPDKLERVADEVADAGGSAQPFAADVRDWDRIAELAALVADSGVDLVINSAGGQFYKPAAEISRNGWQAVIETNLSGSFFLARQLHPALAKRQGAMVMIVANLWQRAAPGMAHSGAARAGVVNLMRTLALEWAADGIRVNAVSPGLTDTPALVERYASMVDAVPLKRMATVEEVVDAILFMGVSRYVTGEVLTIDGGLHLA